ncbi:MAG: hypothetical protein M0Z83_02430 [Betaproteobacteria bacterium]|nr:hypothetical protein [Betaproteobacteria bacterium]
MTGILSFLPRPLRIGCVGVIDHSKHGFRLNDRFVAGDCVGFGVIVVSVDRKPLHVKTWFPQRLHGLLGVRVVEQRDNRDELLSRILRKFT